MSNSIGQNFKFFSLLRFALPSMIMMVFMSMYTIIDGIFISRLLGSNALSSSNIVYPALSVLLAVGIMLATGGSAIIAKKIGAGKEQEAREDFSMIVLVGALLGIAIMAAGNLGIVPLVKLLGATDKIIGDCIRYLRILLFFAPACILQLLFQSFFATAGKPGIGLTVTVLSGITNGVLDFVFMGPLKMGIGGAALATGIGQAVSAVFGLIYFFALSADLYFVKPIYHKGILKNSCLNGSSEMVTNLSSSVVTYLFNVIMLKFKGEAGVAAITIVLYGQFLFNALYLGFSMGVAPVFSYNYGSHNKVLLKRLYRICIAFLSVSAIIITGAAFMGSPVIVEIFTPKNSQAYDIAKQGFYLFSFNYLFAGINIFASSMFTAFSNGKVSAAISFLRTFVFITLSILFIPYLIGMNGVWLSVPIAEGLTLIISIFFLRRLGSVYGYA